MINKYTIDLRQFNNGEAERISFPTFDQCLMYGIYKLKRAYEEGNCIIQAILIQDSFGRRIVINPSPQELASLPVFGDGIEPAIRLEMKRDPVDGEGRFFF